MAPRVSILIAAHDAEAHIAETLRSVFAQTYEDWEVVVADDASRDATARVAAGFGPRVRVVRSPVNRGPGPARDLAAAHARGELFATLDADDLYAPEFLAEQVARYDAATAAGRRVGLVVCDAHLLGDDGPLAGTFGDRAGLGERIDLDTLLDTNPILNCVLVPARAWREAGGHDPRLRIGEDHDLWLRIVASGRTVEVDRRPLATVRVRSGSATDDFAALALQSARVFELALERGGLTARQRYRARRSLRLQRLVAWRASPRTRADTLRGLPTLARVALEHPGRWRHWLTRGPLEPGTRRLA